MTPSGIETASCRFVSQCINHYATAPPVTDIKLHEICSYLQNVLAKHTLETAWR